MATRAEDWWDSEEDFDMTLDAAEDGAVTQTDSEFVEGMKEKTRAYGFQTFVSEAQFEWLKRLAGEE